MRWSQKNRTPIEFETILSNPLKSSLICFSCFFFLSTVKVVIQLRTRFSLVRSQNVSQYSQRKELEGYDACLPRFAAKPVLCVFLAYRLDRRNLHWTILVTEWFFQPIFILSTVMYYKTLPDVIFIKRTRMSEGSWNVNACQ